MLNKEELQDLIDKRRTKAIKAAKKALKLYLDFWKVPDYDSMLRVSQKTYKQNNPKNKNMLDFAGRKKLLKYKIIESDLNKFEVMADFKLEIEYEIGLEKRSATLPLVRVICEAGFQKPSTSGEWGVNPISTYREENVKEIKRGVKDADN